MRSAQFIVRSIASCPIGLLILSIVVQLMQRGSPNDAARSPADTRRPTVAHGTADPDAGFRDPARAPDATIGVIALDIAHCARIRARRCTRMRRRGARAEPDTGSDQQGRQRCLSHDYRPAFLAEREGFEPPIRLPVCRISSAVLSTTQPPLRGRNPSPVVVRGVLTKEVRRNKGSGGP
jgi:hypothetical protein